MSNASPNRQTMSIAEVAEYLGLSLSGATNLFHSEGFPSFRLNGGKRWFVRKTTFEAWLSEQERQRRAAR